MGQYIHIIKIWAILQILLIIAVIILFIITRIVLYLKVIKSEKKQQKINFLLKTMMIKPFIINQKLIRYFNQSITELIACFEKYDERYKNDLVWKPVKFIISNHVFKQQIKVLSSSSNWFNRYLAIRCFNLGVNLYDETIELALAKDKVLLVAVNAIITILNHPTEISINEVIDIFSKERRMLRSALINLITDQPIKHDYLLSIFIGQRLQIDKNVYAKISCYELLGVLRPAENINPIAYQDLLTDNVDLKIAVLKYLFHTNKIISRHYLLTQINDSHEEVRAMAVKLLGQCDDKAMIPYLTKKLSDKAWWVRINSANALANLGEEGLVALTSITPSEDKFAYQTAQAYLEMSQNTKEEIS